MKMLLPLSALAVMAAVAIVSSVPTAAKSNDPYMAVCKRKFGPTVDSYKLGKNGQISCHYYRTVRRPMTMQEANKICSRMSGFSHNFVRAHRFADGSWACMGK